MKKKVYFITTILLSAAVLSLSSCLKDPRVVDFSKVGSLVDFPLGGLENFGADAITATPDTDANGTIVVQFSVNIASPTVPTTATTVGLAIDNSLVAAYNATESAVVYTAMPANTFSFTTTSVTIPANQRTAIVSVTFYKNLLDPSLSYMLPIKIASVSNSSIVISGNFSIHYFHFIGNDFAGAYTYDFRRWQNGTGPGVGIIPSQSSAGVPPDITDLGETETLSPVTPTEFQMGTEYNGQGVNYDVTFTKTGSGSSATYTNWAVQFLPGDLTKWTNAGITNKLAPSFTIPPPAKATDPKIFELHYISGGASGRYIDDTYTKQ